MRAPATRPATRPELWDIAAYGAVLRRLQARGDVAFVTYEDLDWGDGDGRDRQYLGEWKRRKRRLAPKLFSGTALYQRLARLCRAPAEAAALRLEVARQRERLTRLQAELDAQRAKTRELYQRTKEFAARLQGRPAPPEAAETAEGERHE